VDSYFPDPFSGLFIAFELSLIGPKFRGVIDQSAVSSAGGMPDMEEFVVQDVVQHEVGYQGRIEEQADEDGMVRRVVATQNSARSGRRPG